MRIVPLLLSMVFALFASWLSTPDISDYKIAWEPADSVKTFAIYFLLSFPIIVFAGRLVATKRAQSKRKEK